MILHIPHSSRAIPEDLRDQFVLSDDELSLELNRMTDAFTDELFTFPKVDTVIFPISRLLVDVERFPDDDKEPMAKVGMGMIYTSTACGKKLRRTLLPDERRNLQIKYYEPHHKLLLEKVKSEIDKTGKALIVDCHSFPSYPLPCDNDQSIPRPDFCIGTDSFHTPEALIRVTEQVIKKMSFSVGINQPYSGALVPMVFYKQDKRVISIMIEIKRSLYMDELNGMKTSGFDQSKELIQSILEAISKFQ